METSDMWQILPVWNKEARTKMKSELAIIQRSPIGDTELAIQDPLIDTESDDEVSSSVVATRKMASVDDTINNSKVQMDNMVPYYKFSNQTYQQVHDKLVREKHFALAKGYYQSVNELNHY